MFDKIKELSKDTAIYGISTIVGRFLGFLLVPFYTNVFTTSQYGIFTYLYTILAFLNIAYIYGFDAAFLKYSSVSEFEEKKIVFSTPQITVGITSLLFSGLIIVFSSGFASIINVSSEYVNLIYYLALIILFDTLALIPFAHLRLERKSVKFATIKTINILINLSLNLYLILALDYGIEAVFISNLAATVFSFVALLPEMKSIFTFKFNTGVFKKMFKFGIPYLPASIAAMMVQMIDVPILRELSGDSVVGVYRANYKLGIFMMLFVSMFQYAWQPFFLNNAKDKHAKEIFSKVLTLFLIVASAVWLLISVFIKDIANIEFLNGKTLIGQDFLGGIAIVPVILLAYIFHGMYVNFTAGIYIEEKTSYFPVVTIAGALTNILINLWLIPIYGFMGAAIATVASYMVMSSFLLVISQKFYKINYEFSKVFLILAFTILGTIFIVSKYLDDSFSLVEKLILIVIYIIFLVAFNILKISEVKSFYTKLLKK